MSAFGLPASAFAPVGGADSLFREADLRDRLHSDGLPFIQASIGADERTLGCGGSQPVSQRRTAKRKMRFWMARHRRRHHMLVV